MATTKDIGLDDIFTGATANGSGDITVPLTALSGDGGLTAAEVTADDGRKIGFALIQTMAKNLLDIAATFDAINSSATDWVSGIEVSQNDYVKHLGIIYKKTSSGTLTSTTAPASATSDFTEQNLTQEPDNFKIAINNARYAAGSFGSAEITQTFTVSAVYQGTTDLKDES
jgi:hypothetical protein